MVDFTPIYRYHSTMKSREVVANRVEPCRRALTLTQEELAGKVGVTRQTIIAIERGNYIPSLLLAMKLAREFDRQIEEVFTYEAC